MVTPEGAASAARARLFAQPLANPGHEAFVQALARDASLPEAVKAAGFAFPRYGRRLLAKPLIAGRLDHVRARLAGGGSRQLAGLIDQVLTTAVEACAGRLDHHDAVAARGLFELAARLKEKLPAAPGEEAETSASAAPAVAHPTDARLTDEEWNALYGPPPPGGVPDWKPEG